MSEFCMCRGRRRNRDQTRSRVRDGLLQIGKPRGNVQFGCLAGETLGICRDETDYLNSNGPECRNMNPAAKTRSYDYCTNASHVMSFNL
jgi:hypothetical protein